MPPLRLAMRDGLLEIAEAIGSELDFTGVLAVLARKTAAMCGADRCSVYLWRDGVLVPAMSQYASGVSNPAKTFRALGPLRLDEAKRFEQALAGGSPVHVGSGLIVPLARQRRVVGLMHLNNCQSARPFEAGDVELARVVAGQLALVIDNARLAEETQRRLRDAETLLAVGQAVSSTLDVTEILRRITRAAARVFGADASGLYLVGDGRRLEPLAGYHVPKDFLASAGGNGIAPGVHPIDELLRPPARSLWSDEVPDDPRFAHEIFHRFPVQSLLITGLPAHDEVVGLLVCAWFAQRRRFSAKELQLAEAIATHAAVAVMKARLSAKAEELAVNRERVRVAHELHDRLSQTVFSLGLKLEWSLHQVAAGSAVHAKLLEVQHEARWIMSQMRHLIYRFSPDRTPEFDFSTRLRTLVEDFQQLSGIPVACTCRGDLARLGPQQRDILFKTFQEGLANVVKHARATRVSLTLDVREGVTAFEIAADGVGAAAPLDDERPGRRRGLRQMIEWIEAARGHLTIDAAGHDGFALRGEIPRAP